MTNVSRVVGYCSLYIALFLWVGCGQAPPPQTPSNGDAEIETQVVTQRPVLELGKEIEAPRDVLISPWQPSDKCIALADEIIAQMSTRQKAGQMAQVAMRYLTDKTDLATYGIGSMLAGGSDFPPDGVSGANWAETIDDMKVEAIKNDLEIPMLFGIDAVHGNAKSDDAVVFPHNIGLGCTGDAALVEETARITAIETLGSGVDWAFSPVLAAARDERWGRTYESFSETPEQAAAYGLAMVKGLQGEQLGQSSTSVLACAKHFAGDGATIFGTSYMEGGYNDRGNTAMSDADFWRLAVEQYIPSIEAGVGTVMISYSSVNGRTMHGEKNLITNILKGTLGYNGFVVTDWRGIDAIDGGFDTDVETAINAGIDMVMIPDDYKRFIDVIDAAVPSRIPQERVDDATRRIVTVKCEMGMFEEDYSPLTDKTLTAKIGSDAHRALARKAVAKSLVLLKNENKILPLTKDSKIWLVGSAADNLDKQCGGWTVTWMGEGGKTQGVSVLDAVTRVVGNGNVFYSKDASQIPQSADMGLVVVGEDPYAEWRGDRENLNLDSADQEAIANMKKSGLPFVVVLFSGRPMIITHELENADGFIAAWLPGTEGDGIADVLFGDAPATGKLSFSWPKEMEQIPINQGDADYAPLFPLGFGLSTDAAAAD